METGQITLSELTRRIESVFTQNFGQDHYWVIAEITGHKFYPNKQRHYFDLVEKLDGSSIETARIKGKAWTEGSDKISEFEKSTGQLFTNGLQVLIKVKVEYHIVHSISATMVDINTSFTLGNLEKQRQATLQKLVEDNPGFIQLVNGNYVTKNNCLKLPPVIQYIAVISSPNSEGYNDFIHTLTQNGRGYKFKLDLYYSTVQGMGAERDLVNALIGVYNSKNSYDAVAIIRGGGAKTDFLVFDTYSLSRAVAKFPIPIITGIGHLNDVSIADRMAHSPTKTPTEAAAYFINHNRAFEDSIIRLQKNLIFKVQQVLNAKTSEILKVNSTIINRTRDVLSKDQHQLNQIRSELVSGFNRYIHDLRIKIHHLSGIVSGQPKSIISSSRNELGNIGRKIFDAAKSKLSKDELQIASYRMLMQVMNPESLLKRGFAMVKLKDRIIADHTKLNPGDKFTLVMSDAEIESEVNSKTIK